MNQENWRTWHNLEDHQILGVIADGGRGILRGCHWGAETRFAVLDLDADSQYHSKEKLEELLTAVDEIGLKANVYQSSDSGGWHLYIPFADWEESLEVKQTIRRWLQALGYEIKGGQLEVFPSGNALRLPLQPGFAWLDQSGNIIKTREQVSFDDALCLFLRDLEEKARNWQEAKILIESQIEANDRAAGGDAQEHKKAISTEGFDELFKPGLIAENYQKGREYWRNGLTGPKQRHEAILCIQHYLWYGDAENNIPALPGEKYEGTRYRLILAWLEQKHNGHCRHIRRGKWRKVEKEIEGATAWRKTSVERIPYLQTERAIEVLIARSKRTKTIWTMDDLRKGNEGREKQAREKIRQAVELLRSQGRRVTCRQLMRLSHCSYHTVRLHSDIWAIDSVLSLPRAAGDSSSVLPFVSPGLEKLGEEIQIRVEAGCVLDSLRSDRTGQTVRNSRQVTKEVLATVHPIQSNYGVKHELAGSAPRSLVAAGGRDCGINGASPGGPPPFNPRLFVYIGAPAPNLRQVRSAPVLETGLFRGFQE